MYNTGLVKYYSSLCTDALETFKVALNEQRNALRQFYLDVAEICVNFRTLQLEIGKLSEAMDIFLEALMIF